MKYIDLFAGAGGFSEGFIRAGFTPVAHIENDFAACFTLKTRIAYHFLTKNSKGHLYDRYLKGKITRNDLYSYVPDDLLGSVINLSIGPENNSMIFKIIDDIMGQDKIDLIVGGPPCQAYSLIGRARDKNGMKDDPRNYLYLQYAQFLRRYTPKAFIFENVMGMVSAQNGKHFENLQELFDSAGYRTKPYSFNANIFGVLQNRNRLIIVGWQKGINFASEEFTFPMSKSKYEVRDVLEDLPKIQAGGGINKPCEYACSPNKYLIKSQIRVRDKILTQHIARPHTEHDKEIYRIAVRRWKENRQRLNYNDLPERLKTHNNRTSFTDRFKVLADDLPCSQTVVAHIAKDGHYYIHPDEEQNRSITVREAARLQSFPDNYYFEGVREDQSRTAAFRQIGNAVPPLMIENLALKLKELLKFD